MYSASSVAWERSRSQGDFRDAFGRRHSRAEGHVFWYMAPHPRPAGFQPPPEGQPPQGPLPTGHPTPSGRSPYSPNTNYYKAGVTFSIPRGGLSVTERREAAPPTSCSWLLI